MLLFDPLRLCFGMYALHVFVVFFLPVRMELEEVAGDAGHSEVLGVRPKPHVLGVDSHACFVLKMPLGRTLTVELLRENNGDVRCRLV